MKKTTPQKLSNRIAQYSALTVAMAGIADANGQIYYSGILDDTVFNDTYSLDLDGDGNIDFKIDHSYYSSGYINDLFINRVFNTQNGILGSVITGPNFDYMYPFALSEGLISSGDNNWNIDSGNMYLNLRSCNYLTNSNWCNGESESTKKYLGLRFEFSGEIHYGWARLEIGTNPSDWVIKDYAYNETAGESITVGQETLDINDNVFTNVKIIALNKSIALYNLPQATNYKLYTMTGKKVLDGNIANNTYVIEANTLATGVYIIELEDTDSKAVIRKKIVL